MSTLLTDLDSSPPVSSKDGDLVDQILKEMNGPPLPPPAQVQNTAMNSYTMSTNPATAHVIGGAHPTPADFAAAIHGVPPSSAMYTAHEAAPAAAVAPAAYRPSKKSYMQRVGDEFKIPIMVAILFFVFSLPVTNVLFAHYLPWTILTTGQLKTTGLLVKSLIAGSAFWVLQRVVVPLFSQ